MPKEMVEVWGSASEVEAAYPNEWVVVEELGSRKCIVLFHASDKAAIPHCNWRSEYGGSVRQLAPESERGSSYANLGEFLKRPRKALD